MHYNNKNLILNLNIVKTQQNLLTFFFISLIMSALTILQIDTTLKIKQLSQLKLEL